MRCLDFMTATFKTKPRNRRSRNPRRSPVVALNPEIESMLQLTGKRFLVMDDGLPITPEMLTVLESRPMRWARWQSMLFNYYEPYDSRTEEWSAFVDLLVSSPLKNETMGVMICHQGVPKGSERPPREIFQHRLDPNTAVRAMVESRFCKGVELRYIDVLFAKFAPISESLPFILSLYSNPAPDTFEARYPVGCYITSMMIWLKDWRIRVDLFRQ